MKIKNKPKVIYIFSQIGLEYRQFQRLPNLVHTYRRNINDPYYY